MRTQLTASLPTVLSPLDVYTFREQVGTALNKVRAVLQANHGARLASDVHHRYDDKFLLAEYLVSSAMVSLLHCFSRLGVTSVVLAQLAGWTLDGRAASMEFCVREKCAFLREETWEVEGRTKHVLEEQVGGQTARSLEHKTVETVREFFWAWTAEWEIAVYPGANRDERTVVQSAVIETRHVTNSKEQPFELGPEVRSSVNLSWLMQHLDHARDCSEASDPGTQLPSPTFRIRRRTEKCATPRRNPEVEAALQSFEDVAAFAQSVTDWVEGGGRRLDLREATAQLPSARLFSPVLPLLRDDTVMDAMDVERESRQSGDADSTLAVTTQALLDEGLTAELVEHASVVVAEQFEEQLGSDATLAQEDLRRVLQQATQFEAEDVSVVVRAVFRGSAGTRMPVRDVLEFFFDGAASRSLLPAKDANDLLAEERRCLNERCADAARIFGSGAGRPETATLVPVILHVRQVAQQLSDGLCFLEAMLQEQVIAAIGKVVSPQDFGEYMLFHNRKLFRPEFAPRAFCYAVRRSMRHAPEGSLSINARGSAGTIQQPISTLVSTTEVGHLMSFPLGASVQVPFTGERHVHAACLHSFSSDMGAELSLQARARQFCSMIILVGRISSATTFEPQYASILTNKDDLTVPLNLATIPSPKEFKDAIASLSPEQQRFAKAFREMQLQSTLFAVLVVQIKPHLERVLGLPAGALTKELELTQDLMELFIDYQIPSDLLACTAQELTADAKVSTVRSAVKAAQQTVKDGIRCELEEAILKGKYELAQEQQRTRQELEVERRRCTDELQSLHDMFTAERDAEEEERRREKAISDIWAEGRRRLNELEAAYVAKRDFSTASAQTHKSALDRIAKETEEDVDRCVNPVVFECMEEERAMMCLEEPMSYMCKDAVCMEEVCVDVCLEAAPANRQASSRRAPRRQQPDTSGAQSSIPLCEAGLVDYTELPRELDRRLEALDVGCVRPTIITPGDTWSKTSQPGLLAEPSTTTFVSESLAREKAKAFDLLDALSLSGSLTLDCATLHVVVVATHCFDKTVTDTLVQDNVNPIEQVERSTVVMGSTVHKTSPARLLHPSHAPRLQASAPALFQLESGGTETAFCPPPRTA